MKPGKESKAKNVLFFSKRFNEVNKNLNKNLNKLIAQD